MSELVTMTMIDDIKGEVSPVVQVYTYDYYAPNDGYEYSGTVTVDVNKIVTERVEYGDNKHITRYFIPREYLIEVLNENGVKWDKLNATSVHLLSKQTVKEQYELATKELVSIQNKYNELQKHI